MQFPPEIEAHIKQFAQPCAATLRPNWREGSIISYLLNNDPWWLDYIDDIFDDPKWKHGDTYTWVDWCHNKMIIGDPRRLSDREYARYDFDLYYMTNEDWQRHFVSWRNTWPEPDDYSLLSPWCRGVPDWAKEEFLAAK